MQTAKKNQRSLQLVDSSGDPGKVGKALEEALFEQSPNPVLLVSSQDLIEEANEAAAKWLGEDRKDLRQRAISDFYSPSEGWKRGLSQDLVNEPGYYEEISVHTLKNESKKANILIQKYSGGTVWVFTDATSKQDLERELILKHKELKTAYIEVEKSNAELKALQEALIQAGKMAALGELAAGISHELNQPLMGIRGYSQELEALLERHPQLPTEAKQFTGEIITSVDKMAKIIKYLRTFTRKSVEDLEVFDVHEVIEESLTMLSKQLSQRNITVEKKYAPIALKIFANKVQLEQVFINLATNARDAIEETKRGNGKVVIITRDAGSYVEIEFQDDGVGMSEKTKAHAFHPFFTTKEVGQGMGLGLSLSYGILSKVHGSMTIQSELGKGARFFIKLPKDYRELGTG